MKLRHALIETLSISVLIVASGCGGSSGGGGGTSAGSGGGGGLTTGPSGNSVASLATTFQVNVSTGKVTTITPTGTLSGSALKKPGLFTGNSVAFNSSVLSNDALGGTGIRSLQVSITNNTDLPIGVGPNGNPTGLNVIFGAFSNTTGISSQTANTNVSTFAGSTAGFANGATSVAKFDNASGIAIGSDGSLYIADFTNNRIRKINSGYVSTLAGTGTAAETDGVATTAAFNGPYGIAYNPVDGSLIVADYTGNKIRRVTGTGVVNTVAGTGVAGSANGTGSSATFTNPTDVAVDSGGNIYVSESNNNRIRKITLSGSPSSSANYTVASYAGSGTAGLVDGNGMSAEFDKPYGLCIDPSGNLYAADYTNNVIRRIDPSANVTTIAGTGAQSDLDGYGNAATFNRPIGVAFLNGALFVSEGSGYVVREVMPIPGAGVTSSGWVVETLAGQAGSSGDVNGSGSSAKFSSLRNLVASPSSSLYVADFGNSQIRRINPSTGTFPIGTPTGGTNTSGDQVVLSNPTGSVDSSDLGQAPYISYPVSAALNPGASTLAQSWNFVIPQGVTSFQFQVLVESATSELLPLQTANGAGSPSVDVRSFAGSPALAGFQDGVATEARFGGNTPGLAVDGNGIVYMADVANEAIRRIGLDGAVTTIAGVNGVGSGSSNGLGTAAQFDGPYFLAVNSAGTDIYVSDATNDEIRLMELTGSDPSNAADWSVYTIAGTAGTASDVNGPGTTATLNFPVGIAISPSGIVYVSEDVSGGNRIRALTYTGGAKSSAANWQVTTAAGNGTAGYVNSAAASAEFDDPLGLCCDVYGNLYIADKGNSVIRELTNSGTVVTFAGPASNATGYVDGTGTTALFNYPYDICADSAGYIYVADTLNDVIRRISPAGVVSTVAGQAGEPAELNGSGLSSEFYYPSDVAVSPSGDLYVNSAGDYDIRLIQTVVNSASGSARPNTTASKGRATASNPGTLPAALKRL